MLLSSKKHDLDWAEGPARAKKTGGPRGQVRSEADIDFGVRQRERSRIKEKSLGTPSNGCRGEIVQ